MISFKTEIQFQTNAVLFPEALISFAINEFNGSKMINIVKITENIKESKQNRFEEKYNMCGLFKNGFGDNTLVQGVS